MKIKFYDDNDKEYDSIEFFVNNINKNADELNLISLITPKGMPKEEISDYYHWFTQLLKDKGVTNFGILIVPSKDEVPVIQKIKIEKEDD